jgi:3-hydroxybutyryl-CoA dehydrogenase
VDERLAIAGSGAIACGLAAVAGGAGEVLVLARSAESASRAAGQIRALRQKLPEAVPHAAVSVTTNLADLADATYLVEAVAEDVAIKTQVLSSLATTAGPDAVLATTTSSLSIGELGAACGVAERFAGLHVFNPVHKMELVEVAFPDGTTDAARRRTIELCEALDKRPVVVPDIPGFVVNRLLFPYLFSAVELLEQTDLTAGDVDRCMTLGAAHPMGPLALLDLVGLDVSAAIGEAIGHPAPKTIARLVEEGRLGRKSGRGFHVYDVVNVR